MGRDAELVAAGKVRTLGISEVVPDTIRSRPDLRVGSGASRSRRESRAPTMSTMSIQPTTSQVPVGTVLLAGLGAQLLDDAVFLLFPPSALLAPLAGALAILLTAGAARAVTRGRAGPAMAHTGLAVGVASAGVGLLVGGLGLVALVLAGLTVVAGLAGAMAGRR